MIWIQVDPDVKPLITEIKLDIDAIKPEYGGHLERFTKIPNTDQSSKSSWAI